MQDWLAAERATHLTNSPDLIQGQSSIQYSLPANTWPLQDLVLAKHDNLHSRIFNS